MSLKHKEIAVKLSDEVDAKSVDEVCNELCIRAIDDRQIVYLYNVVDDTYYKIDNIRIDSENDVVMDISPSSATDVDFIVLGDD
ncbi:MAG: hypothetical protein J6Y78_11345 [Paludibacteraceae bacterium]|nr:hypothetical protein [Paludibacteraceae bacterium]